MIIQALYRKNMQIPYEIQIGLRYTRAGRNSGRNGFISFISGVSMMGIALGVATLIIVLSVMNGFQKDVRDKMLSILPAVRIISYGEQGIPAWPKVIEEIKQVPGVMQAAPYVEHQVLLVNGDRMEGILLSGIDPQREAPITEVASTLYKNQVLQRLVPGEFNVIIGNSLANRLRVGIGDKVTIVAPTGQITPAGVIPRLKQMTIVGIFSSQHYEYDAGLAMINIEDAQRLFRISDPLGIRVNISDMQNAQQISKDIHRLLNRSDISSQVGPLLVTNWTQENKKWFDAVQMERTMMFIILLLIVAVAAFNLVSTLVMTVTDKQADIAILRTLGARPASIMGIFMVQGLTVGFLGTFIGVGLGYLIGDNVGLLAYKLETMLGIKLIAGSVYVLDYLPSDPKLSDITVIAGISLLLAFLATLYPSWRASRVNPAEALRYE